MTSAPHLLTEDRPEFQRLLDEALRNAPERPDLASIGERLNAEQLRTMAMDASGILIGAAAPEYEHFVKVREDHRDPALRGPATADEAPGRVGAGAVVAVLAPVLSGTAMLIFLLVGYLLKLLDPAPAFAGTMLTAGWLFGALTVLAILFAAVGLLVTAVRNSATEVVPEDPQDIPEEVSRAREAWQHALLERGILPFLRDALADPGADPAAGAPYRPAGRIPQLGYTRPDFTSPAAEEPARRPGYSSPDFTSPDVGGPDRLPD
ncbi:hypothetical protein [Streptomyces sp. NPDC089919]|uniref:hypothetical protein n=1 Tax=Streptomyces sp. NPDC089919 TaxID=3155188 RepID=UPI00344A1359